MFKKGDLVIDGTITVLVEDLNGEFFSGKITESSDKLRKVGSYSDKWAVRRFVKKPHHISGIYDYCYTDTDWEIKKEQKMEREIKVGDKVTLRTDIAIQLHCPIPKGTIFNVGL